MRRFLSILASLTRFATLAVALMLACLAPQAEALLTPSDPVLSEPLPQQAHAPESILIIEEIHSIGYADDGECLDLCVCVEPETHTRVFCIVKSPTGLDFDDGYSSSGLPYYYGRSSAIEEMILYNGYNNVVGFLNGGVDAIYGSGLGAAIPQPQDFVTGSQIMSQGMFDSNNSVVDRFKLTGVGFFVSFMGLLDVVDYIPDPLDALQKSGKNLANDILQKSAKKSANINSGAGKYMNVRGHHVHAKKAFEGLAKYDPRHGFSLSADLLAKHGVRHADVTASQSRLFRKLAKSGSPNTLTHHTIIAYQSLVEAGMKKEEAWNYVAESLKDLIHKGVLEPSNMPWNPSWVK